MPVPNSRQSMERLRLFRRHRFVLAFLQAFGGSLPSHDLHQLLFIYSRRHPHFSDCQFLPWRRGCFSLQLAADGRRLQRLGILETASDCWRLADRAPDFLSAVAGDVRADLEAHALEHRSIRGDDLARKVHRQHPYYAINSELAAQIMNDAELAAIRRARPALNEPAFFTIGYEGISIDSYLNRLVHNDVRILCDVRRNPFSRKHGFSKAELSRQLKVLDIEYAGFHELGIESQQRSQLHCRRDYQRLFAEYRRSTLKANGAAMERLAGLFSQYRRIAITCFEADHSMCHRSQVAAAFASLTGPGTAVVNI